MLRGLPLVACALLVAGCARGVSGASGGGGPGPAGPPPPGIPVQAGGLIALVPGPASLIAEWATPAAGFEAALFVGADPDTLLAGSPVLEGLIGERALLGGQVDGVEVFAALGIRAIGTVEYVQAGAALRATPGGPVYVDSAVPAAGADGTTPATAFPDLASAVATALAFTGANVWVAAGNYDTVSGLIVPTGVHVYGGFEPSFDPLQRDPELHVTSLTASGGPAVLTVPEGDAPAVLDGLTFTGGPGGGGAPVAIDVVDAPLEAHRVRVTGFADRGIRVRNASITDVLDVTLVASESSSNLADGLSAHGPLRLRIDGCAFDGNFQEGVEVDDLVAPGGEEVRLDVSRSRFFGNGAEGLDVDLVAPVPAPPAAGSFVVDVRGSSFERNTTDGLLVDIDYEGLAGWLGRIELRELAARANGGAGVHVDADWDAEIFLHRVLATANDGDGVWVSSESNAGAAVVSASVLAGNLGAGLRASLGNVALLASHCVLAGNFGGGIASEVVESGAASCVAYLQPVPWTNTRAHASLVVTDPFLGTFTHAAEEYGAAVGGTGDTLSLIGVPVSGPGATVEVDDDGVARTATAVVGASVTLDPPLDALLLPAPVAYFAPAADAVEDYTLPPGSPALGAGMAPPGAPATDLGPFGSPAGGAPGVPDELSPSLLRLVDLSPAPSEPIGSTDGVVLAFSETLDPASVAPDAVTAVAADGSPLAITFQPIAHFLFVSAPTGGWGTQPFVLEVHAGFRGDSGAIHAAPVAVPFPAPTAGP
jgi:hypothetical protein